METKDSKTSNGPEIPFRLIRRGKSDLNGVPVMGSQCELDQFARFSLVSDPVQLYQRHWNELSRLAEVCESDPDCNWAKEWIDKGLQHLSSVINDVDKYFEPLTMEYLGSVLEPPVLQQILDGANAANYKGKASKPILEIKPPLNHSNSAIPDSAADSSSVSPLSFPVDSDSYYYYQRSDGQPIFLSSLPYRILVAQAGAVSHLPLSIHLRVEELQSLKYSEVERKKYRFLAHLPDNSPFSLAFGQNFTDYPISAPVLQQFHSEITVYRFERRQRWRKQNALNQKSKKAAEINLRREEREELEFWQEFQTNWELEGYIGVDELRENEEKHFPALGNQTSGNSGQAAQGNAGPSISAASASRPANWSLIASKGLAATSAWASLDAGGQDSKSGKSSPMPSPGWGNKLSLVKSSSMPVNMGAPVITSGGPEAKSNADPNPHPSAQDVQATSTGSGASVGKKKQPKLLLFSTASQRRA